MKNKKKEKETKNKKTWLKITIIAVIVLILAVTSFFLIRKYTGIDYKLKDMVILQPK